METSLHQALSGAILVLKNHIATPDGHNTQEKTICCLSTLVLLIILTLCFVYPAFSADYYVDASGGCDSNIGTDVYCPLMTVNKVNAMSFSPGDCILFKRGEIWREQLIVPSSGIEGSPITFGAYGSGDKPLFMASTAKNFANDWIEGSDNVWYSAGFTADVGSILADGTVLTDKVSAKANLLQQGQFFYDSTNKYVWMYSTSNPAIYYNGSLECWYRGTALSNGNIVYASEKNYITFQDLELKYGGGHGLQVANCTNILTQRLTISYVGGSYLTGTTRYGNGMEVWGGGSNITLQNNDVSQTFDEGITTQYKSVVTQNNIIIQDNIVDKCGRGCALSSFGSPGASISNFYCRRNVFTNCGLGWSIPTVSNGEGKGIQLNINDNMTNGNVTENIIQNTASGADPIGQGILVIGGAWNINKNWIQNTHNSAIRVYSDPTLIVSYNAVVGLNGKPAIFLNSWTGYNTNETLIVNNTVYDNNNKDTTVIKLGVDGGYEVSRVTMNNNIIMMAGNSANELIQVPSGSDVTLDYNLCYRTTAGPLVNWKGTNYMQADWEAYKAASSQDANSPAPNDPKFVSTVVPDFHLQPTSTCINSGVDVGVINFGVDVGVIKSYKAPVPKTTAPNIGAFANVKKNLGPIYLLLLGD